MLLEAWMPVANLGCHSFPGRSCSSSSHAEIPCLRSRTASARAAGLSLLL